MSSRWRRGGENCGWRLGSRVSFSTITTLRGGRRRGLSFSCNLCDIRGFGQVGACHRALPGGGDERAVKHGPAATMAATRAAEGHGVFLRDRPQVPIWRTPLLLALQARGRHPRGHGARYCASHGTASTRSHALACIAFCGRTSRRPPTRKYSPSTRSKPVAPWTCLRCTKT